MELKEIKITKMDLAGDELGWRVDIVAHLNLAYLAGMGITNDKKIMKSLIDDINEYLKNHWDITKGALQKSGK